MKAISPTGAVARVLAGLAVGLTLAGAHAQQEKKESAFPPEAKAEVLEAINRIVENQAYVPGVDFSKWDALVKEQQEAIDKAKDTREFSFAINGALHKMGFSHIVLISPDAAKARITRKAVGVGIQLQPEDDGLRVVTVFENSPAAEAGLQLGDLVIEGNGKPAKNPADLAGDVGSVLELKVKKNDGSMKEYKITRREYSNVRPETLKWVNEQTAVLKIPSFDLSYSQERVTDLMTQATKAKSLILDLRSNGGGAVLNLMHLMGHLMPTGTPIGSFVGRRDVKAYVEKTGGKPTDLAEIAASSKNKLTAGKAKIAPFKGNIVVLVNGGSGSASEIAAAALKETLGAQVIGSKSAGAVLVSIMAKLPQDFVLQFPLMDYVTPNGVRLEGNGIVPNIEASEPVKFGDPDQGVEKAVAFLQKLQNVKGGTK